MAGMLTRMHEQHHGHDNHGKDKGRNYNRFANPNMALVSTSSSSDLKKHGNESTLALAKSSSSPALGADLHWMQPRAFDANGALDTSITLFPPSKPSAANLPKRPEYRPTIGGAAAARMRDEAMGPTIPDNSRLFTPVCIASCESGVSNGCSVHRCLLLRSSAVISSCRHRP